MSHIDVVPQPMTQSDDLRLQQLTQMDFWRRRQKTTKPTVQQSDLTDNPIPLKWELLREIQLHPWQESCVEKWFCNGRRGVIKVVTGAGKTILALAIAERLQSEMSDLRVAIIVPTIVLVDQWRDVFLKTSNLPPTAIATLGGGQDGHFDAQTRVLICVLNSAAKKLPEIVKASRVGASLLLVVDECHRAGAFEMQKVFRVSRACSLGLSATPERDSEDTDDDEFSDSIESAYPVQFEDSIIGKELGPVVYELNYADAINMGILPPFTIIHYGLSLTPLESVEYERRCREIKNIREQLERPGRNGLALIRWCRSRAAADNPKAARLIGLISERKRLLFRMEERSRAVVRILHNAFSVNSDTTAILFHESIDEVMRLFAILKQEGFPVIAEHSGFPDQMRATSLKLFRDGSARVLVSARSLIEGFNIPAADLGIIVAASSSVRQRVQTLGRLLRKSKSENGTEKNATLHVLYASKTVDEAIYEKADWECFVGAERNQYFLWDNVAKSDPQSTDIPPRRPKPDELALNELSLHPGETYPGKIDQGLSFTRDTQATIRSDEGALIEPHPELLEVLKHSRKSAGRFRVTPIKNFVVELEKIADGWRGVYLGRLRKPIRFAVDEEIQSEGVGKPGDPYPLSRAVGKTFSVLQRDSRLIATKANGKIRFVSPLERIPELDKRNALVALQSSLKAAYAKGHRISKITVTKEGHVVYVFNNQAIFIGAAPEGAAGFVFES